MRIYVPSDLPKSATVEVWMNGSLVERFAAPSNAMMTKSWVLPSQANAPNDLRITTDEAVTPAHDPRTLGLRVDGLTWTPM